MKPSLWSRWGICPAANTMSQQSAFVAKRGMKSPITKVAWRMSVQDHAGNDK